MTFSYTVTMAARFASEQYIREDAVRVMMDAEGACVICVLAGGSETGWDVGCGRISRRVLDAFEEVLSLTSPSVEFALERAFMRASRRLVEAYESEHGESYGTGVAEWSATTSALCLHDDHAEVCWAGSDAVVLVRDGQVIARTRPDVVAARFLQVGAPLDAFGDDPNGWVMTCALPFAGTERSEAEVSWTDSAWSLRPGDALVMASASFWMQTPEAVLARILRRDLEHLDARLLLDALPDTQTPVSLALVHVGEPGSGEI